MGNLLEKPFVPLGPEVLRSAPANQRRQIGIVWASIDNNSYIREKYIPVDDFLSILDGVNGDVISFQRSHKTVDQEGLILKRGIRIVPDDVLDAKSQPLLDSLVKEICRLDCMVTISTTTAHIAASMGTRVILMAAKRKGNQWFWQAQANHQKCFYPTAEVFLGKGKTNKWWENCLEQANKMLLSKVNKMNAAIIVNRNQS